MIQLRLFIVVGQRGSLGLWRATTPAQMVLPAEEDVMVSPGDGIYCLLFLGVRAGWSIRLRAQAHIHGDLIQAVHVALHLIQQALLLSLRDAAKTHSCGREEGA